MRDDEREPDRCRDRLTLNTDSPDWKAGHAAGARAALERPLSQEMLEDIARLLDAAELESGRHPRKP